MKKKKLNMQANLWIGQELFKFKKNIQGLSCYLSKHYAKNSKVVKKSMKIYHFVCDLTGELDACLFRDNPNISTEATGIYYPGQHKEFATSKECFFHIKQIQKLAAEIEANVEMGEMFGEQPDKTVHRILLEAFKKYKVDVIREAYKAYLIKNLLAKDCICGK